MQIYKTEQEAFWAGEFGDDYLTRNQSSQYLASNIAFFSKILSLTTDVQSVLEFGPNVGVNLKAIKLLKPEMFCTAVEINNAAATLLERDLKDVRVVRQSLLDFVPGKVLHDFVLIKGVLIHIDPAVLSDVYKILNNSSAKYICIAGYYNPTPVEVVYRGHVERLFKRDFAGEMLDQYPDLVLEDYGFVYHRDNNFSQDDMTWFLLKKRNH